MKPTPCASAVLINIYTFYSFSLAVFVVVQTHRGAGVHIGHRSEGVGQSTKGSLCSRRTRIRQAGEQGPERRKRSRRSQERVDQTCRFSVGGERSRGRVRRPKFKSVFPRPSAKTVKRFSPFFFLSHVYHIFFGVCMLGCQCTSS